MILLSSLYTSPEVRQRQGRWEKAAPESNNPMPSSPHGMRVCVHTCARIYPHTRAFTHLYTHKQNAPVHPCTRALTHTCTPMHTCTHVGSNMHCTRMFAQITRVHARTCTHKPCACARMHTCMSAAHMHIHVPHVYTDLYTQYAHKCTHVYTCAHTHIATQVQTHTYIHTYESLGNFTKFCVF